MGKSRVDELADRMRGIERAEGDERDKVLRMHYGRGLAPSEIAAETGLAADEVRRIVVAQWVEDAKSPEPTW